MPEENSQMDALLKAYAAKRRAEAGEPWAMPAFTRQMLQNEIPQALAKAKNAPPSEPEEKISIFLLWPRLSLGLACLALFLGLLFWFQPKEEPSSTTWLASKENATPTADKKTPFPEETSAPGATIGQPVPLAETLAVTPPPPATLEMGKNQPLPAAASISPTISAAQVENKAKDGLTFSESPTVASTAIPPPQPALPARNDAPTENQNEQAKPQEFARRTPPENMGKSATERVLTSLPASSPDLSSKSEAAATNLTTSAPVRLHFTQENRAEKYRQNLLSPPQPEVLTAFQWERVQNQIRITDGDGSIYEGQILPADDAADASPKTVAKESFTFSVSGTNRALQQLIVIQGTFANTTNQPGTPAAPAASPLQASPSGGSGGLIQGKIQIGHATEFEIKAQQTSP